MFVTPNNLTDSMVGPPTYYPGFVAIAGCTTVWHGNPCPKVR